MTDARTWLDQVDARTNAMPGPWEVRDREIRDRDNLVVGTILRPANAEHIAAARTDLPAATKKLRAVLDLHAPRPYDAIRDGVAFGQTDYPDLCCECRSTYPCPTITALEDA
ncbi:hypothetical protein H9623_13120 [Oerskovia sp. Sa1BUA8]|uniref:Uncharacterized protein n=1 Tax=Oerskovia douganii TaxID=2762210 RepID=A0A9D5UHZ3_9CELL|nr:hypothetical protein [Oerskovia douganii]MBE7701237.1 hypothetical protein [Oerskovia douganii]